MRAAARVSGATISRCGRKTVTATSRSGRRSGNGRMGKGRRSRWMPIRSTSLVCGSATSRKAQVRRDRSPCLAGRAFIVHGTVTTKLNPNGTVSVKMDRFNFDLKPWYGNFTRNVYTLALRVYVGPGTPFNVYFRGTVPIAP